MQKLVFLSSLSGTCEAWFECAVLLHNTADCGTQPADCDAQPADSDTQLAAGQV
jgi:hypothetical protein